MYQYAARLIRVIDGDTVVLDLDLGFYQWRLARSYRLARINAPEMSTREGPPSRDALVAYLQGKALSVQTAKADSFDRWIVELWADNQNTSDYLVEQGFAEYKTYT